MNKETKNTTELKNENLEGMSKKTENNSNEADTEYGFQEAAAGLEGTVAAGGLPGKSPKEETLDRKLVSSLEGVPKQVIEILISDPEVHALQAYANHVSIARLRFNDHGPVHMRQVAMNVIRMTNILKQRDIKMSLEEEGVGSFEDSQAALLLAAFLHDAGMTVGREDHEHTAVHLVLPLMDRILKEVLGDDIQRRVICRSMAVEAMVGHMGHHKIHSREAGLLLVADGCDMEKGRARIPMMIHTQSEVGDIHKYSASAVESVRIKPGEEKPVRVTIEMTASVGFFQVEEVLMRKMQASTVQDLIELYAGVIGKDQKRYL